MVLAITGVTGKLGSIVAKSLAQAGIEARHLARSPERATRYENAQIVQASYEDSAESLAALTGVDILFMVSGSENPNRLTQHYAFIDAAKKAGVKHIIYTSFYNAKDDSTFTLARDHAKTERYIIDNGFSYTFLRDNFYLEFFLDLINAYDEIRGPAGAGKCSAVSRTDVAEVAARVLQEADKWENQILNMTGPEDLTMQDMLDRVSAKTGKKLRYVDETLEEAYESRKKWKAQDWEYNSWVSTYTAIKTGEQAGVSEDIERVLGRPAKSLQDLLK